MLCTAILQPIVILIRTIIQIIRQVVETVCGWVSSTITVIKEVVERVCRWLPWPLSELCNLVTRLIEVVETVWDWVCEEVITRIIDFIEIVFEYVIYVLKWICWLVDWILFRLPELLLCLAGLRSPRFMGVCVKIIARGDGTPGVPLEQVQARMREAAQVLRQCNITMVVCNIEIVIRPQYLTSTTCNPGGMFSRFFTWFSARACGCCSTVTVYFVEDIVGAAGCAYPGTDWVTVAAEANGNVVVQEIGHLADLWAHSDDPNNVMFEGPNPGSELTRAQCCVLRSSRFATMHPPCNLFDIGSSRLIGELDRRD